MWQKFIARHFLLTAAAFIVGSILAFKGLLNGTQYVALVGTLHLGYAARTISEDIHEDKNEGKDVSNK